ncbi:hypothetical protein BD779DRAFT_1589689, partial [Infundibulicybe gibba]
MCLSHVVRENHVGYTGARGHLAGVWRVAHPDRRRQQSNGRMQKVADDAAVGVVHNGSAGINASGRLLIKCDGRAV